MSSLFSILKYLKLSKSTFSNGKNGRLNERRSLYRSGELTVSSLPPRSPILFLFERIGFCSKKNWQNMPSPVDETGSPSIEAANTVNALDRSMTKPREGVNSKKCHFTYTIVYFLLNTPYLSNLRPLSSSHDDRKPKGQKLCHKGVFKLRSFLLTMLIAWIERRTLKVAWNRSLYLPKKSFVRVGLSILGKYFEFIITGKSS